MDTLPDNPTLHSFMATLSEAPAALLLLDYDGTLAPFRVARDEAVPYPGVREALSAIMTETDTRVVFISGRTASELPGLLDLPRRPEIWGAHGWERLDPDGRQEVIELPEGAAEALAKAAAWAEAEGLSKQCECKIACVALHWRGLPDSEVKVLRERTEQAWQPLVSDGSLSLREFDGGIELRAEGRDKGSIVEAELKAAPGGCAVAYLGDDFTDEDAFRALAGRGLGVLVRVEPRESAAALRLRPPEQLLTFFDQWHEARKRAKGRWKADGKRLVIAANRLPVVFKQESGRWQLKPAGGGLVTALRAVLQHRGGLWVGWPGTAGADALCDELIEAANKGAGFALHPVTLTEEEVRKFYFGFSNEIIWPLFHHLVDRCHFDPSYWQTYLNVNRKFAARLAKYVAEDDYIWVHDYHLMNVASELRRMGFDGKIGFFLHIPFPPLDVFLKLPWRAEVMKALLEFDLLGFQTFRDRRNFMHCVKAILPDSRVEGRASVVNLRLDHHEVRLGNFPISIDFREFENTCRSERVREAAKRIRLQNPSRKIVLGVDRLDYTKGIPNRIRAFENLLERYPELHQKITFVQIVAPSREDIPEYDALRSEIEQLVSHTNGRFTQPGWVPIHYLYRGVPREDLLAYYLTADMALVTPLCDGMNLVAKEYCACKLDNDGVLVLSEFAGAAAQLAKDALVVNPYDLEGVANALYRAFFMDREERRRRMRRLRAQVRRHDIQKWVDSFLGAAFATNLDDFPLLEPVVEYIPSFNGVN